jgi:hypothetical protein
VQLGCSDDGPAVAPADAVQATMTGRATLTVMSFLMCRRRKVLDSRFARPCAPWAERLILRGSGPTQGSGHDQGPVSRDRLITEARARYPRGPAPMPDSPTEPT